MAKQEDLQIVIRAVDQASANLKAIHSAVQNLGSEAKAQTSVVEQFGQKITSLGQSIKTGLGIAIGQDILGALQSGFDKLAGVIPDAIKAGNEWAKTVNEIQRETGMSAEQTSELLAVMQRADVPLDNSQRLFAMLGKRLGDNAELLHELGVATVDASGKQLDAYTIVQNLRHEFSTYGASLEETKAAQELFSRSGFQMLEFLQLNDEQFRLFSDAASQAGQILNEDAVQGAERFRRELGDLGGTIQGLQTGIFAALEPTLESFIAGFSDFLKAHMRDIMAFVVGAANFVMGVIGGLLGIDFQAITLSKEIQNASSGTAALAANQQRLHSAVAGAAKGEDTLTRSINEQVRAIDAQIRAIDEREGKRKAAGDRVKLQAAIEAAQAQLGDLQGNTPYTAGLSSTEATLALQKHDQDILDARKKLSDAIAALNDFDAGQAADAEKAKLQNQKQSLQDQLSAHKAATGSMAASYPPIAGVANTNFKSIAAAAATNFGAMTSVAQEWRNKGVAFANDIKTAVSNLMTFIVGTPTGWTMDASGKVTQHHSGGLLAALDAIGQAFGQLASFGRAVADGMNKLLEPLRTLQKILNPKSPPPYFGNAPNLAPYGYGGGWTSGQTQFASGGFLPAGGWGTVGEVAAEAIYANPGGGVTVVPGAGGGSGSPVVIPLVIDGREIARIVDSRLYYNARSAPRTTRAVGAF